MNMNPPIVFASRDVTAGDRNVLKKLPEVTLAFWIMTIAATTLGEIAGALFTRTLPTTIALFGLFIATLVVQLRSRRYHPFFFWTVILSAGMAGTTIADFMNHGGLGYPAGAVMLTSLLLAIFCAWKSTGLSVNDIGTFRGEALFWSAILVSTSLGTSIDASLLITGLLAILLALKYVPAVPDVPLFWLAFVLTRPLGAAAGDFLTKEIGKLGSSVVLLAILLGLVAHESDR